jgi:hypothetical protein
MMGGGSTRNMHSATEISRLRKVTSHWLYIRNISDDAWPYECEKWREYVSLKHWTPPTRPHRVTTHETIRKEMNQKQKW